MAEQTRSGERRPARGYAGPVIDCDVHHARRSDEELLPYLAPAWREYVAGRGPAGLLPLTVDDNLPNPHGFMRADSYPPDGGAPGSDLDTVRRQLLDPGGVERAILTYGDDSHVSGLYNGYLAAELARALNDWTIERWLDADERLLGSILVACQLPDRAAAEVRRLADEPRMVQVMLVDNPHSHGFGHPLFHPLYEAAVETGRPVAIHAGAGGAANPPSAGGGNVSSYFEAHVLWPQALMTHLVSFVAHGVFDRYPELRLVLIEGGAAWLPPFLWRLDTEYKGLRREVPWVRRLPSEYFAEHVFATTQPLDAPPRRGQLAELLSWIDGGAKLLFASDYPHWDADERDHLASRLPKDWHRRVFHDNAAALYGLTERSAVAAGAP